MIYLMEGSLRCAATLVSGKPCSREAQTAADVCARHARVRQDRAAHAFYITRFSPQERQLLAEAAQLEGVEAEIAVLRVLIRRVVGIGDLESARKGIETLCRTLRMRHDLDEGAADRLSTSIERVLDTVGGELGVSL
jgi:hypothetical protein